MKKLLFFIVGLLMFSSWVGVASAHATPISYSPDNLSVLEEAPETIEIRFNERIDEPASSIDVYSPDGEEINIGDAYTDSENRRIFKTDIDSGSIGVYTVSWRVVSSDDGHFTKGSYSFRVGEGGFQGNIAEGQSEMEQLTSAPQAIVTSIEVLGQAILIGALLLLTFLLRPFIKKGIFKSAEDIKKKLYKALTFGAVLIIVGSGSYIIFKTLSLQDFSSSDFIQSNQSIDFLSSLFSFIETSAGSFAFYRLLLGILVLGVLLIRKKKILKSLSITKSEWVIYSSFLLMVLARARISHAAASDFYPNFSVFVNFVHLISKDILIGSVTVTLFIFLPILYRESVKRFVLHYLDKITAFTFAIGGLTGSYIVWLHLKEISNIFSTKWGMLFVTLVLFAVVFLLFRLYHFLISDKKIISIGDIRTTLTIETIIGLVVLFFSSYLIVTTPPYIVESYELEKTKTTQDSEVSLSVYPSDSSFFVVDISDEENNQKKEIESIVISLSNNESNISSLHANSEKRAQGRYIFKRDFLSPPGNWEVNIIASQSEGYDINTSFNVDYPDEVDSSIINSSKHEFGYLGFISVALALLLVILGVIIYRARSSIPKEKIDKKIKKSSALLYVLKGLALAVIIIISVLLVYNVFLQTDFQKLCEYNNHQWNQTRPMRSGVPSSPNSVTGCTIQSGMHHFADFDEYQYYVNSNPFSILR